MTISLSYNDDLSRVQISLSDLAADRVRVERSLQGTLWDVVRGGRSLAVESGSASLDDFEFTADVQNHYRVIDADTGSTVETSSIKPSLADEIWLKSIRYPLLNRRVTVTEYNDPSRAGRDTVHQIPGRSLPVATAELRAGRQFSVELMTETGEQAAALDLVLAAGGVWLIHTPPDCVVPGGYVTVGAVSQTRPTSSGRHPRRYSTLPCIAVVPPGPDVVGTTLTWRTVKRLYGDSWAAVVAAHPTWTSLLALVGDEDDLVVI